MFDEVLENPAETFNRLVFAVTADRELGPDEHEHAQSHDREGHPGEASNGGVLVAVRNDHRRPRRHVYYIWTMPVAAVILVEPALPGNLGAAIRVAANFGVPRIELVRPLVELDDPEIQRWACGGRERLEIRRWQSLSEAASGYRTLVASASGRGRENQPLVGPREARSELERRGLERTALVFGNETSGLRREDLDRCDLVIRIPTVSDFPVLNLTQTVAILLGYLSIEGDPESAEGPIPASSYRVTELMEHLHDALSAIGFLDSQSPQRTLRKLRRLFGRAGITDNEVAILRGMCRQMLWAARTGPLREQDPKDGDG